MKIFVQITMCCILTSAVATELRSQSISIVAYNIQMLPYIPCVLDKSQEKRISLIPPKMSLYEVIVFSEVFDDYMRRILIQKMKHRFPYYTNVVGTCNMGRRDGDKLICQDGGVMIFSMYPIVQEKQKCFYPSRCDLIFYSKSDRCLGDDCLSRKGVIYAKINKAGFIFHVFGSHTQASYRTNKNYARIRRVQFQMINDFVEEQNIDQREPIIIAGDLNVDMLNSTSEFQAMLQSLHAVYPRRLGPAFTYNPEGHCLADNKDTVQYLDYILYRSTNRRPSSCTIETKLIRAEKPYRRNNKMCDQLSDHYPVNAVFIF